MLRSGLWVSVFKGCVLQSGLWAAPLRDLDSSLLGRFKFVAMRVGGRMNSLRSGPMVVRAHALQAYRAAS